MVLNDSLLLCSYSADFLETASQEEQQGSSNVLSGKTGLIVVVSLAILVFTISVIIVKRVFFNRKATSVATPDVPSSNGETA